MDRFIGVFKSHPMWIVGGVIGVVILIWLMTRGGSTSGGGIVSYGPSDAVVMSNAATEKARIEANAGTAQAQLAAELQGKLADVQAAITMNTNATAAQISTSQDAAAIHINDANVKGAVDINAATINGTIKAQQDQIAGQLASQNSYQYFWEKMSNWHNPVPSSIELLGVNTSGVTKTTTDISPADRIAMALKGIDASKASAQP